MKHLPWACGLTRNGRWTGEVRLLEDQLDVPLHWKRPRKIFVADRGDLFHPNVPFEYIAAVFGVMAACPQHTFLVLTKRPERMLEWFTKYMPKLAEDCRGVTHAPCMHEAAIRAAVDNIPGGKNVHTLLKPAWDRMRATQDSDDFGSLWPLPNVFLGVTCEDQQRADERIPLLLQCPASVRFVSVEPLLGPLDMSVWLVDDMHRMGRAPRMELDWIIVGGESGSRARPCNIEWIRSIRDQCKAAGTACFVKQLGAAPCHGGSTFQPLSPKPKGAGADPSEWPEDLRVREWPMEVK